MLAIELTQKGLYALICEYNYYPIIYVKTEDITLYAESYKKTPTIEDEKLDELQEEYDSLPKELKEKIENYILQDGFKVANWNVSPFHFKEIDSYYYKCLKKHDVLNKNKLQINFKESFNRVGTLLALIIFIPFYFYSIYNLFLYFILDNNLNIKNLASFPVEQIYSQVIYPIFWGIGILYVFYIVFHILSWIFKGFQNIRLHPYEEYYKNKNKGERKKEILEEFAIVAVYIGIGVIFSLIQNINIINGFTVESGIKLIFAYIFCFIEMLTLIGSFSIIINIKEFIFDIFKKKHEGFHRITLVICIIVTLLGLLIIVPSQQYITGLFFLVLLNGFIYAAYLVLTWICLGFLENQD